MAFSVKPSEIAETGGELHANKIVIVTGPSFGTGLKLVLFGAVLGAAGALYWKNQQESPLSTPAEAETKAASARLKSMAERIKDLSSRAANVIHTASEVAAPALQNAMQEFRHAARETEAEIKEELREMDEQREKPEQV